MFAGPILPPAHASGPLPEWWQDLDGRTVVHVTQGTIDNQDFSTLIGPTLLALADEDVLTVATTGGRPIGSIPGPRPDNARIAEFIPYDLLLPRVDVMVTNGGYGGSSTRSPTAYRSSSPAQPKTSPTWPPGSTGRAPASTSAAGDPRKAPSGQRSGPSSMLPAIGSAQPNWAPTWPATGPWTSSRAAWLRCEGARLA